MENYNNLYYHPIDEPLLFDLFLSEIEENFLSLTAAAAPIVVSSVDSQY